MSAKKAIQMFHRTWPREGIVVVWHILMRQDNDFDKSLRTPARGATEGT